MRLVVRGLVVFVVGTGHLGVWLLGWLGLLLALRRKPVRQRWFARCLRSLLRHLGATYVKIGQIMSSRPDLFAPHVIRELERLQDDVGAFSYRQVERTFRGEFGRTPDQIFARFERTPIASASVAQVHRAVLADGRELAVKVRRPRLEEIVAFDLAVLRAGARLVALWPPWALAAPVEMIGEFGHAIRAQIDLTIEAANNRRFHQNFAGDPDVELPILEPALCSRRVLTMSFIRGRKINERGGEPAARSRLARIGFRVLLKMVFDDGFVHADLHPGNILVTDRGKVALLDLGLTAELDDDHRRHFASYFAAWAAGDGETMARIMTQLSPRARVADPAAYLAEVKEFVARYHGKSLGEVDSARVAFDMLAILRRHRIRANPTFTMCNIAIAMTEGIGKQLDPSLDLMTEGLPFFFRLRAEGRL